MAARGGAEPAHDGLPAMRLSLALLAFGTLTTWLLAGGLSRMLAGSLPFHQVEIVGTLGMVGTIFLAPTTWLALGVIALGCGLWIARPALAKWTQALKPVVASGLGFEWLNQRIVNLTKRTASALQLTQTGQLNWNIAGILAGLVLILLILVRGA